MTMVQRENPELFDLYYGDYIGIISNYLSPIHSIALILNGCQKYIDINKTKEAYTILCYCCKYFENNPHCGLVFYFIEQNIIVDYFNNDKLLLILVINLINLKINSDNKFDNDIINDILEKNKTNIDFYLNKNLINDFEK